MSWIEDPGVEIFDDLDLTKLNVDEAYLRTKADGSYWLYELSDQCYRCPYTKHSNITTTTSVLTIDVTHSTKWRVYSNGDADTVHQDDINNYICEISPNCGQFGVYDLSVNNSTCDFKTSKEPVNIYLPLLVAFFCLTGLTLIYLSCQHIKNKYFKSGKSTAQERVPVKRRIRALDTFRGMSIVLMIFVNDGAGRYWWLEHATWNGLTVGDLVFPFFMWIMGVCIPISVKSLVSKNVPKYISLVNIFRRSCTLFLIGVALNTIWGPTLATIRIFGVLQRFGVSYFFVASMMVLMSQKWKGESENKYKAMFQDIIELGWQWFIMIVLVAFHSVIIFFLPVPGCDPGYLGPGGKHENWAFKDCIGGATKYIDELILGDNHLYQNPTAKFVYESGSFDPEGIFGCILSIVHVFFGVQAGNTLLHHQDFKQLIPRWLGWAFVTGLIGAVLCNFAQEDGPIPVNKNLWSLSYVLVTSCFAFVLLSICYVLIDVTKWWNGTPFIEPGMNAIVMYVGHMMCYVIFPFHWRFEGMRTHFVFLMEALWGTLLWIVVAFVLAKKKIFITI